MKKTTQEHDGTLLPKVSRREFLTLASSVAATSLIGGVPGIGGQATAATTSNAAPMIRRGTTRQPNILFVFTDQERYLSTLPAGFSLPAHERLRQQGVTFLNHQCPAVMCTSSRAVILTGLQTADNRMFENCDMPYVKALSPNVPTIGHMLRKLGYYTAYKGKFHLNSDFDREKPDRLFTEEMEAYGFSDFIWPGDVLTHTLGGYKNDAMIAGSAVSWLRDKGNDLNAAGQPWSLFVSLVNPHDIMYFNTDAPGESVQDTGKLMMHAARAPQHALYRQQWHAALPASLTQPLDAPGRPGAHGEFDRAWGYTLGRVPLEAARWERFSDFYFNSLRAVDQQLDRLLQELDALDLTSNTIVVFTSDHGEMGGAHGLRGKGPMAYKEVTHLPLYVVHPDVKGGADCRALTGHIDLAPTLLAMAGADATRASEVAGRDLPGRDASGVLARAATAEVNAVRDAALYTYSGIATNDSELIGIIAQARAAGQDPKAAVQAAGYRPNLKKRGSLRSAFDGRYRLTRYFSPIERNTPQTLDELFQWNDVELFDLQNDPGEMVNLAMNRTANEAVLTRMNNHLNTVMQREFGADDGREMPPVEGVDWSIDRIDL